MKNIIHFVASRLWSLKTLGVLVLFPLFLLPACESFKLAEISFPEVITGGAVVLGPNQISLKGEVKGLLSDAVVEQYGHYWSVRSITGDTFEEIQARDAGVRREKQDLNIGNGNFETTLTGLTPGATYYYRAYAIYEGQEYISQTEQTFTLASLEAIQMNLVVNQVDAENRTARVTATFSNLPSGLEIKSYGVTWALHPNPDIEVDPFLPRQSITLASGDNEIIDVSEITPAGGENFIRPFMVIGDEAFYGAETSFVVGNIWVQKADFPGGPTAAAASFTIGDKAYLLKRGSGIGNFWEFDPNAGETDPQTGVTRGKWTEKAGFPGGAREAAVGFALEISPGQWKGYMGTGGYNNDFYEFDPQDGPAGKWIKKADYPRVVHQAFGFAIGNKGYLGGGITREDITLQGERNGCELYPTAHNFYEFDPTDGPLGKWIPKANLDTSAFQGPCAVSSYSAGFTLGGRGYVAGGEHSRIFEFEPKEGPLGKWKEMEGGTPGKLRQSLAVFVIGNVAYMGLGRSDSIGDILKEFWKFEPTQGNKWTRLADFGGDPRELAVGFAIGRKGYVGTGRHFQELADFWEYTPAEE